ncbi:MAG: heme exporter protein CcmD [Natronohydrobacter sp.]|nr:heme exporter protein CcmD [Legionellaceae bacterium]MCC5957614.1 heme exporter protein CcmD [Natronohydrobacter sp.]
MTQWFEWLTMGKYSLFVWPAYGLVCVILVMQLLGIRWQRRKTMQRLQHWFKRHQ